MSTSVVRLADEGPNMDRMPVHLLRTVDPKGVEGDVILCGLGWIRYSCLVHDGLVLWKGSSGAGLDIVRI